MTDTWSNLARQHGRRVVMSLSISNAELDVETARQAKLIFPTIAPLLTGKERTAVDYGCGAGRFTPHVHALLRGPLPKTVGFDPCQELLAEAPTTDNIAWECSNPDKWFERNESRFDLVFIAMVLGDPNIGLDATICGLTRVTSPGGFIVLIDHMDPDGKNRWWQFRTEAYYRDIFSWRGIKLHAIGSSMQLENRITIMMGRKP